MSDAHPPLHPALKRGWSCGRPPLGVCGWSAPPACVRPGRAPCLGWTVDKRTPDCVPTGGQHQGGHGTNAWRGGCGYEAARPRTATAFFCCCLAAAVLFKLRNSSKIRRRLCRGHPARSTAHPPWPACICTHAHTRPAPCVTHQLGAAAMMWLAWTRPRLPTRSCYACQGLRIVRALVS